MYIDPDELADLRADLELSLTDPLIVQRKSAADGAGLRASAVYMDQPAGRWPYARAWNKQSPKDMAEAVLSGQLKAVTFWYVLVAWDLDVRPADRLRLAGMTLEVAGRDGGRTDGIGQTILCHRIE